MHILHEIFFSPFFDRAIKRLDVICKLFLVFFIYFILGFKLIYFETWFSWYIPVGSWESGNKIFIVGNRI